jgi:hypothetical protein
VIRNNLLDRLKSIDIEDALDVAARALEVIGALAGSAGVSSAADVVMAIKHVVDVVDKTAGAQISPDDARIELAKLLDGITSNDAAADAAADDRFDTSDNNE